MKLLYSSYVEKPKKVFFVGEDKDENILLVLRKHPITNLKWILIAAILFSAPFTIPFLPQASGTSSANWLDLIPATYKFALLIFWYIFSFGYLITSFLIWFFSTYIISDKRVVDIDFHGFTHRSYSEAFLRNIEDLTNHVTGAAQVIFHYGTLHIQTAGESREIEFELIPNPGEVQDFISDLIAKTPHRKAGRNV